MPELVEQMYCSQQIVIPPKFPYILKRYCKAAIKTQPYDLLRWSYEYFTALAEHRPPPVKLRLEYPIYSTEGGLTRGCLKVLANQLSGMTSVPLPAVRQAWRGFCLDTNELNQILCLCEVYMREEEVSFLRFIAVAGGLLTKTLTHTMILLCETLTHEPDGGSAAIPVQDFLVMYRFLAAMDASKDVKYLNGYREGETPKTESTMEEEEQVTSQVVSEPDQKLRQMSGEELPDQDKKDRKEEKTERKKEGIEIVVHDEDGNEIPYEIYGEHPAEEVGEEEEESNVFGREEFKVAEKKNNEIDKIKEFLDDCEERRLERIADLEKTFEEIEIIVDRFKSANYDLGMVAGRQMSTTSGEFIVAQVERDIMDYINEQIAILPDPDLKKKKAKPEEVAMIKELVENYLDENMEVIVPEVEEVEEEELPIPEVTVVYAVPGIGPEVDEDLVQEVEYYLLDVCKVQADMVMPRNIRHFLCPPLEKYKEHDYDNLPSKEELAAGGALTD
ncbi:uncharacterized protein LOC116776551 isoform X2 [Danaus plexippus]|uniref:uncharacterized protein LOC116776551 isoform X2 n=1 Tax=Danaus plexippus TaxID=13037 RepID=UPI002AB00371|nr:uncharacterized protein LOC116776551 isoform X2 [Danaus plexippus]